MTIPRRLPSSRVLVLATGLTLLPMALLGQGPTRPGPPGPLPAPPPRRPMAGRAALPTVPRPSPGERLYLRGISTAGGAVEATVQGDVHITSREMACVDCHRRSGMGTAEGTLVVPPILGGVLFAPLTRGAPQLGEPRTTGAGTRPAYTDEALLRALRDGVDPAGRLLSATMPRYAVTEADAKALGAYLRTLGEPAPPGVDEAIVHIATIVTPTVSAARRSSMLDVLRSFVRAKNGGTRYETRRREKGPWDMKQQYQGYRDWVLDEWELHGVPRDWPAQLEELYKKQPVYALVSGIADEDWSPIDAFCARHRIPAILPQTPLPPASPAGDGFYSFYFSMGVTLEAQAVAHHLEAATPIPQVRQVSRCETPGQAAAAALGQAFRPAMIRSECLPASSPLSAETWSTLIGDADTLVVWLDAREWAGLEALATSDSLGRVRELYLSSTLLGDDALRMPPSLSARALLANPFVTPDEFDAHAVRSLMWMKANGIKPSDRRVAVNAFFAIVLAADALNVPRTLGSREYFVETIEHMANRSVLPTAYPSISFDSKRRFASGGSHLLKMPTVPGEAYRKVEEWHVPKS